MGIWLKKCKLCEKKHYAKGYCVNHYYNNITKFREKIKKEGPPKYRTLRKDGYVWITKRGHPNAAKDGRILEHTYVMSEFLGRPLVKGESIHHKNGIRDDNRIENLELWIHTRSGQRLEDRIKWAIEFLEKHGFKIHKNSH